MSAAPAPSPSEQAVIDGFGIFHEEIPNRLDIGAALAAFCDMDRDEADEYAEILLPTVDRIARKRAADEMRAAADAADTRGLDRAADHAANWLRDRAAALDPS